MKQVDDNETAEILRLARSVINLPGGFVEMGCYEGDTSLMLMQELHNKQRLWIYDSFEGLPSKTVEDESEAGKNFQQGVLAVSKKVVKARFLRTGLPVPVIKKAWFSDLTDSDMPEKICFAFLDGDLYQSIKDSLRLVGNKMVAGGVIIVHDYNNPELPGVTKAVDEWLKDRGLQLEQRYSLAVITF